VLSDKIGTGSFASVHAAGKIGGGGESLAVKVVDLLSANGNGEDPKRRLAAQREVAILEQLRNQESVVHLLDAFVEEGFAYIVMEKCDITLWTALDSAPLLTQRVLTHIFDGMLKGIAAVHSMNVVHRDIKPDNFILSTDRTVKLCDFGLAGMLSPEAIGLTGVFGTAPFLSPEMLRRLPYGQKTDVWSFGAIAYTLQLGRYPYMPSEASVPAMKSAILHGEQGPDFQPEMELPTEDSEDPPPPLASMSDAMADLIQCTLNRDASERPDAAGALHHRVFATAEDCFDEESCFKPYVYAARRIRAFRVRSSDAAQTAVDLRLSHLQRQRHGPPCELPKLLAGRASPKAYKTGKVGGS